jgi:hypothetical protein
VERVPCSVPHFVSIRILLVCTANVCRSPMAQAILADKLARRRITAEVVSAGLLEGGLPTAPEAIEAVAADGPSTGGYRSRSVVADDVSRADLVRRGDLHGPRPASPCGAGCQGQRGPATISGLPTAPEAIEAVAADGP